MRAAAGTSYGVPDDPRRERGFSLVIVLAAITIMMIMMGVAAPTWRYVMQDDREQELYYRGDQIARAIEEYQRKNGNTFPASMDVLLKGKFLRKVYKDPMTRDGKWHLIHPGEGIPGRVMPGIGGAPGSGTPGGPVPRPSAGPTPSVAPRPDDTGSSAGFGSGGSLGAIVGVVSTSKDKSLRLYNGQTTYDKWTFVAGQPRQLGRVLTIGPSPGAGAGGLGRPNQQTPPQ